MLVFWKCCHFTWFKRLLHNLGILYEAYFLVRVTQFLQHLGRIVDALTETATLPVEDADPKAVVTQDALIPPAPHREEPAQ